MNIKNFGRDDFFPTANGIVLDDAYDLWKRKEYIKYVKENNINYIRSQDVDMVNITYFPDIEYLSVPGDAENLEALYTLKNLKGISLGAKHLEAIDLSSFLKLEYMAIDQPRDISEITKITTLKHLFCAQWKMENLTLLSGFGKRETLVLDFCGRLMSLQGIERLISLDNLTIDYCLKLRDIDPLINISNSLKNLRIVDCNKIAGYDVLEGLTGLEQLHIANFQTYVKNSLKSLAFVRELRKLRRFFTNYRILDGDMSPLANVEDATCDNQRGK